LRGSSPRSPMSLLQKALQNVTTLVLDRASLLPLAGPGQSRGEPAAVLTDEQKGKKP
jgi:hypothetical protein